MRSPANSSRKSARNRSAKRRSCRSSNSRRGRKSGSVRVGAKARVRRDGDLIYNGEVASLRRFKDDVKEVKAGLECGIRLDNFADFLVNDEIEIYEIELKKATL